MSPSICDAVSYALHSSRTYNEPVVDHNLAAVVDDEPLAEWDGPGRDWVVVFPTAVEARGLEDPAEWLGVSLERGWSTHAVLFECNGHDEVQADVALVGEVPGGALLCSRVSLGPGAGPSTH